VRDRLPELALGGVPGREAASIDRHLAWCAACRREADDLVRAAAVFPYTLEPAALPDGLAERVAGKVARTAGARRRDGRRGRTAIAAAIAATVAVAALGWGAAMAGRADRLNEQIAAARRQQLAAVDRFRDFLNQTEFQNPHNDVSIGTLSSPGGAVGGAALALMSPDGPDFAIVSVDGLPSAGLPYAVSLGRGDGAVASVGKISRLDTGGGGRTARDFKKKDLAGFTQVAVKNADGDVVLSGALSVRTAVPSPSPSA
jgi:hypothetical protein